MASKAASGLSGLAEIRELSNCTCWRRERGKRKGKERGKDGGGEDRWERWYRYIPPLANLNIYNTNGSRPQTR